MEREVDRIFGGIAGESAKINASKYSREALSLLFKGNLHESFKIWNSALKFAPWLINQTVCNIFYTARPQIWKFRC